MTDFVKVFHLSPKEDHSGMDRTHVANINVTDMVAGNKSVEDILEMAFERTQNFGGSWSVGPSFGPGDLNSDYSVRTQVVAPLHTHGGKVYGLRSSMVGDEFEFDGKTYRCAPMGFEVVK